MAPRAAAAGSRWALGRHPSPAVRGGRRRRRAAGGRRENAVSFFLYVDTQTIDLRGHTVIPGIIDVHAHLDREGLKNLQPGLEGVRSIADILEVIKREVATKPPSEWVVTMPIGDRPNYADIPHLLAGNTSRPCHV